MSYEKMNNEMRGLSDPKKVNISNMIYMLYSIGTKKASIYFRIYNKYIGNTTHTEISLEVRIRDIIDGFFTGIPLPKYRLLSNGG